MCFLGLDLGTSGLRALLVSEDGSPIASAERSCSTTLPHPGWSEQDPAQWIAALEGAIAELRSAQPAFRELRGIAVSGHMHGAVLLDRADHVIRPCILWNDTRAHAEAAQLDGLPGVRELSGNIVFPGFTAPKLAWLRSHEPDAFERVARVLLPAAFLNLYLTGDHVSDMSDAAGTAWLDTRARCWSDRLLEAGQMRAEQMPRLVEGCAPAGQLRPELARLWGLNQPVTVAGGAGDNAAAACGMGTLNEGQGFVSLGTSGVLLLARDGYAPQADAAVHTFCHAVPDRWYQMGVMLSATDCLNWLSRIAGRPAAELAAALGDGLAAPGELRFLPYLSGERTPHNDAGLRGAFTGLATSTTLEDMTRAVFEGVAFGLRDSAEAMGLPRGGDRPLWIIGGGSASDYWVRLVATVLAVPLALPRGSAFGAALGAARLARVAVTGEPPEQVMQPPEAARIVAPEAALLPAFDAAYERFRASYPAIRSVQ